MATTSESLQRLAFVGGSPRSGTTLVQRMLNCHPEIYGGPEFDYLPEIAALFEQMLASIHSGRIDSLVNEVALTEAFRGLIVSLLIPKADAEGVRILTEKTPANVLAFSLLDKIVPESKKILVIRDPRDVINSMLEVGNRQRRRKGRATTFVRDVVSAVNYYNQCLLAGAAAAERHQDCLVVYYEDVVAQPLEQANRMYAFLGLSPIQELIIGECEGARNKETWIDWKSPHGAEGEVTKSRVGAGLTRLSRAELSYIAAKVVRHPLICQKYELSGGDRHMEIWWCQGKAVAMRVLENLWRLPRRVYRRVF